jgi:hypothetical protein
VGADGAVVIEPPFEVDVELVTLPLIIGPALVRELTGDERSERAIRNDCSQGVIPTLPRGTDSGGHYRIPTVKYLEALGISYEIRSGNRQR